MSVVILYAAISYYKFWKYTVRQNPTHIIDFSGPSRGHLTGGVMVSINHIY